MKVAELVDETLGELEAMVGDVSRASNGALQVFGFEASMLIAGFSLMIGRVAIAQEAAAAGLGRNGARSLVLGEGGKVYVETFRLTTALLKQRRESDGTRERGCEREKTEVAGNA